MSTPPSTTVYGGRITSISDIHPDIIKSHILTKLDGPTLASAATSSRLLRHLCADKKLWSNLCTATWPSTSNPLVQATIASFPLAHRSYFSESFPTLDHHLHRTSPLPLPLSPQSLSTPELISAVDLRYNNDLIFSKVQVNETDSDWFLNSPFRVDMLDTKEIIPTRITFNGDENTCLSDIEKNLTLSWVVIDPTRKRSVNLSSFRPVFVKRHWLTGHVQIMYNTILSHNLKCNVEVLLGGSNKEGGELSVWEVSMNVEDMEGKNLNGRGSLVIMQQGLGRKRMRTGEEKERHEEYLEMRREMGERRRRRERILDIMCIVSGVVLFLAFFSFILFK